MDDADAAEWIGASFGKDALEYVFEPMLEGFYARSDSRTSPVGRTPNPVRRPAAAAIFSSIASCGIQA